MKSKQICLLALLFVYQIHFAQHTDIINSNRPSESMSAFAVGKNVIQLESGMNYLHEKHALLDYETKGLFIDVVARYGFWRDQLEFIPELTFQRDEFSAFDETRTRSGLKNTVLGFKYLAYDPFKNRKEKKPNLYSWKANHQNKFDWRQLIPCVAGYAGMNLNFKNAYNQEPNQISVISPKVMVITQNIIGSGYVVIGNVFMDKISTERESLGYIVTVTKAINDRWSAFIENKGIKGDLYADAIFSAGGAYLMADHLQVDVSISTNYKNTPSVLYGGIGISWRSDINYEDLLLREKKEKKEESKMDKKKKAKKEKNNKKRLDEVETP